MDREYLVLCEIFLVRYSALAGHHRALPSHRDSNWFSFVVALNSTASFEGGGTCLRDAPPICVPAGCCLTFVGAQRHAAAAVTGGTRFVLAGFVDLRAPLRTRALCTRQMHAIDPRFVCSSCRAFRRPYLRANVRYLERCAGGGRRGRALLELIASRRLATAADLDLTPIEEACRRHLAGEGTALDPLMSKFVARVLERG